MTIRLIFCHGGNESAMRVARECGWEPGARSDKVIYPIARPLSLLDIEYRSPDWSAHLVVVRREQPWLAAVPDVMTADQLPDTLGQMEEVAPHCEHVMVIPKAFHVIEHIPEWIGGRGVILGFSVPTAYGGTSVPYWEFGQRPVHLLGGTPRKQRLLTRYLNIVSLDGNMAHKLATKGVFFCGEGCTSRATLLAADGQRWPDDGAPLEALRRSLVNIRSLWRSDRAIREGRNETLPR